jgi:hypothetical protein
MTMSVRSALPRLLVSAACAAAFAVAPIMTAAPAAACPPSFYADPFTGQCSAPGSIPTVNGIPCIPGEHLGTCMGMLQNMPGGYNPWNNSWGIGGP